MRPGGVPAECCAACIRRRGRTYRVENVRTAQDRAAVARTGATIVGGDHGALVVSGSHSHARRLARLPFRLLPGSQPRLPERGSGPGSRAGFPGVDADYHTYGYTTAATAPGLTADDEATFRTLA